VGGCLRAHEVLRSKGLLTDDDVRQVIGEAEAVAPSQPNARNTETKELLKELGRSI